MVGNARAHPGPYRLLKANFFAETQIPGWFTREEAAKTADPETPPGRTTTLELPTPEGPLAKEAEKLAEADKDKLKAKENPKPQVPIEQENLNTRSPSPSEQPPSSAIQRGVSPNQVAYLKGQGIIQQADGNWVRANARRWKHH
jgi:hypothetical protein